MADSAVRVDRELELRMQEQPFVSVSASMETLQKFEFFCRMNRSDPAKPFPILYIGNRLTIQPSLKQLAQLRDEIAEFLEAEGAANG